MVRKYLGFLLCIAVLLSCFGAASGVTASAANIQTGNVIATYGQTEARSMLASINELRKPGNAWYWNSDDTTKSTPTDLADLTYDYELERYAMQRAAEIAVRWGHDRPDGSDCFTVYTGTYYSKGENIAYGVNTMDKAAQAFEAWCETDDPYSGQGHRRNMLSGNFTSVGIGYATVNGKHCWVQEFGRPNSGAAYTAPLNGDKTVSIRYDADIVDYPYFVSSDSYTLSFSANGGSGAPSPVAVEPGSSVTVPATVPTRFPYTFLGWSASSGASSATYKPGQSFTPSKSMTLYAVWQSPAAVTSSKSFTAEIDCAGKWVYYKIVPQASGTLTVKSTGAYDTYGYLYDGNTSSPSLLIENDDDTDRQFRYTYNVTANTVYYAAVRMYNSESTGSFYVYFTLPDPPVTPVEITSQPASVSAAVDATASFTVKATGTGLTYQWQSSADNGKTWTDSKFSTAKAATLKVPVTAARNGYKYRCVVTGSDGQKATSSAAALTVLTKITSQPAAVSAAVDETASFTVKATGVGLSYQWQSSADNGKTWNDSKFSTAKAATLKVPVTAARNGYKYRCVVTGSNGKKATSSAAGLTVKTTVTAKPASVKKAVGDTAAFTVSATGVKLTYQWQSSADNGKTWTNSGFSTAKTATLKVPVTAARNGYKYRCKVTGANGSVTSGAATLTVLTKITAQPASVKKAVGATASFKVEATGVKLTYQWQYSTNGTTWKNSGFSTAKSTTLNVPVTAARNGYRFRCVVTGSNGQTATSNVAKLTVS